MIHNNIKKICTIALLIVILTGVAIIPSVNSNITNKENKIQNEDDTEYYAIIAACSEYNNSKYNIPKPPFRPYPESQLRCLYDSLIQAENWNESNIILLLNKNATRKNIIDALENMSEKVDSNDIFLFSWQGHGADIEDDDGDEGINNPKDTLDEIICPYSGGFIRDDELGHLFSNIKAKGMCIIFNCCISGGLVNRSKNSIESFNDDLKEEFDVESIDTLDANGKNRVVIMGTLNTIGCGTILSGFPLTNYISLALRGYARDKNKDGFISAEEAFYWARPITLAKSSLQWMKTWVMGYILSSIESKEKLALKATATLLIAYVVNQIMVKITSKHFLLNWPNMVDEYDGELLLVKK